MHAAGFGSTIKRALLHTARKSEMYRPIKRIGVQAIRSVDRSISFPRRTEMRGLRGPAQEIWGRIARNELQIVSAL
jgi:hypothetical protein